ncbi:hypothetical protein FACS1894216_13810 [Synergistales bacterium]|nr:hypothetical protein FACS1894216_13810 [Synergistales bacterium]
MEQRLDNVQKDMLTINSTTGEILRALFTYGAEYIMLIISGTEHLIRKDKVTWLMGQGAATMKEMLSMTLSGTLASKMNIENIPPATRMLLFSNDELSVTTLGEYRNQRIIEKKGSIPGWWGVPLPLLNIKDNRALLNDTANANVTMRDNIKSNYIDKIREERLLVIGTGSNKKTYSFVPLTEHTYLIEDVSGDFETAEDLVWWASVGKAFVRHMEDNGLTVKRLPPKAPIPEGDSIAEVISCSWEDEAVGSLVIELPASETANIEGEPEQKTESLPESESELTQDTEPEPLPIEQQTTALQLQTETLRSLVVQSELELQKPSAEQPESSQSTLPDEPDAQKSEEQPEPDLIIPPIPQEKFESAPAEEISELKPEETEQTAIADTTADKAITKTRKKRGSKSTGAALKGKPQEPAQPDETQPSPEPQPKPKRGRPSKDADPRQETKPAKKRKERAS